MTVQRKQKTEASDYSCEGMVETKSNKRVHSAAALKTAEKNGADLLDLILHKDNLNAAWKKVKDNKGAAGIDGMGVDEMLPYLRQHKGEFLRSIQEGHYKPKPVRRVEIPKPDGGLRLLGVPTVIDRMLQQAVVQVLEPIFERTFSDSSYGFRPNRSAHQAIKRAKDYYDEGYTQVVDIDLEKYFDTVNHDLLLDMLHEQISDKRVLRLIRAFLKSGVMVNGLVSESIKGTPQGGNLSPLLSNIYLTRFDRMLEERGHRFVRYADDCNIYVKSKRASQRVMDSCKQYLEGKLKLKVNKSKSRTASPLRSKFLGFSLYKMRSKTGIRPHETSLRRFKARLRELTSRRQARSIEMILLRLRRFTVGWLSYYSISDMKSKIKELNEWLRRRIRQIFWKQWKKVSAKFKNLKKLGVPKGKAWEWSNSRLGYWRISGSWILQTSLKNKYLESIGYDDISKRYEALHCA